MKKQLTRRAVMSNLGKLAIFSGIGAILPPFSGPLAQSVTGVSGSQSWKVGDFTVTALLDGFVRVDAEIFNNADAEKRAQLLAQAGQEPGKIDLDVNAYIVQAGKEIILIDSGTRDLYGPTLGKAPERLKEAGIDPSQIDKILLTHMHNDHVGGLTLADGTPVFKNAELVVPATEWDFWTSDDIYSSASDSFKFSFAGARAAAPGYRERVRTFTGQNEVSPGIYGIALPGHSIGHSGFRITSGTSQMIIWGDIVVSPQLQFAHPEWVTSFDADAELSLASRKKIFNEAATDKILVAGMHLAYPGFGYVVNRGSVYHFESALPAG